MVKYYEGDKEIYDDGIENPTWVYHPTEQAKIVSADEAATLRANGWFDSPAFPEMPPKKATKKVLTEKQFT